MTGFQRSVLFVVLCSALVAGSALAQQTLIVDGNADAPSGAHVFSTPNEAIEAASDGDVIQIVPIRVDGARYEGTHNVHKSVTIVGNGWAPDNDFGFEPALAEVRVRAPGVILDGLVLGTVHLEEDLGSNADDCTIRNCRVNNSLWLSSVVAGLHVYNSLINGYANYPNGGYSVAAVYQNNIFFQTTYASHQDIFDHNLFVRSTSIAFGAVQNSLFTNNIFLGVSPSGSPCHGNTFSNNLAFGSSDNTLPPVGTNEGNVGSGNIVGEDPMYVSVTPANAQIDENFDINLQPGSPCLGAGTEGSDIGPMSGTYPFDSYFVGGNPLPVIEALSTSAVVVEGGNLQVDITARAR